MTLPDLIHRLSEAKEGSRELDAEIALSSGWSIAVEPDSITGPEQVWRKPGQVRLTPPPYTTSIDAALTLVPAGWSWSLASGFALDAYLTYHRKGPLAGSEREVEVHDAVSLPLALCIASLKARGG